MSAVLQVKDLSFAYPDGQPALRGVDFALARGERVALLGPNGAGKTTLALHLNGILMPRHGSVWVGELEVGAPDLREIRRRVGIVFQDPDDQLFMSTVREDVAFGPANLGWRGARLEEAVEGALAAVGLRDLAHRAPQQLSFGERRRAALATVLAMQPELLVLDEPTSNLDAGGRRALADVLASLDTTLLLITHDLPYALQICRRALVMNEGKIVADAPILECLCDAELLSANRLELPLGFFPELARRS